MYGQRLKILTVHILNKVGGQQVHLERQLLQLQGMSCWALFSFCKAHTLRISKNNKYCISRLYYINNNDSSNAYDTV